MNYGRKTLLPMQVNAKPWSINYKKLNYVDNTVMEIARLVIEDPTTKKARFCTATDIYSLLNWSPSTLTTAFDEQSNAFDKHAPKIPIPAGGLAGLIGNIVEVHVELSEWEPVAGNFSAPASGSYVCVGADGKLGAVTPATIASAHLIDFGVISNVIDRRVVFFYRTLGIQH